MTIALTGIVALRMDVTVVNALRIQFHRVSAQDFAQTVQTLVAQDTFFRENLDIKDSYDLCDCWLDANSMAGYAVTPENELINVFCRLSRQGSQVVRHALDNYDGLHLNCYAGYLESFYAAHGFKTIVYTPNWDEGRPDVVIMRHNPNPANDL